MLPILAHAEELPAPVKAIEKQGITITEIASRRRGHEGAISGKYPGYGHFDLPDAGRQTRFPFICILMKR